MYGNKPNPYASIGVSSQQATSATDSPERQREVDAAADNLEFWAGQVGQTLDRLYSRLQPVLGPAAPLGVGSGGPDAGCALAARINVVTERLTGYQNLLGEIESRLEI